MLLITAVTLGIGKALEVSGSAAILFQVLLHHSGTNPRFALAVVYLAMALLTEMIMNNAAAALMFSVGLAISKILGIDFISFVSVIMLAASASFITPIGYQTNLMIYAPGGCRFTDFGRIGLSLSLAFGVITVWLTPVIYSF